MKYKIVGWGRVLLIYGEFRVNFLTLFLYLQCGNIMHYTIFDVVMINVDIEALVTEFRLT